MCDAFKEPALNYKGQLVHCSQGVQLLAHMSQRARSDNTWWALGACPRGCRLRRAQHIHTVPVSAGCCMTQHACQST